MTWPIEVVPGLGPSQIWKGSGSDHIPRDIEKQARRREQIRAANRRYWSKRRRRLEAAGLCRDCGKTEPKPNRKRCEACLLARKVSNALAPERAKGG